MELNVRLAGLELEHPLMNAAGTCKLIDGDHGVAKLAASATAAIMVGSITFDEREGNAGDVYAFDRERGYSLNALGLPCRGREYYREHLPQMVRIAHDSGKKLGVSIAGFSPGENSVLADMAKLAGVDLIELNAGCPNVWKGGKQKQILSFNPELLEETLEDVQRMAGINTTLSVKISPFSDPSALAKVAEVVSRFAIVKIVTSTNTFPNAFAFADGDRTKPRISVGYAGFAGPALKPIGLGQVKQLRALLPERIKIIGVGGIKTGGDVLDYLAAGATCVQTATTLLEEGPGVFSRILDELVSEP